jgi:hypothetical protein
MLRQAGAPQAAAWLSARRNSFFDRALPLRDHSVEARRHADDSIDLCGHPRVGRLSDRGLRARSNGTFRHSDVEWAHARGGSRPRPRAAIGRRRYRTANGEKPESVRSGSAWLISPGQAGPHGPGIKERGRRPVGPPKWLRDRHCRFDGRLGTLSPPDVACAGLKKAGGRCFAHQNVSCCPDLADRE